MNKNFISAEQFLEQSEKVQKELIKWWENNKTNFDIVTIKLYQRDEIRIYSDKIEQCNLNAPSEIIPNFQMHQVINFIEEKTLCKIDLEFYSESGYDIWLPKCKDYKKHYPDLGSDLLEALWKVTIKIAEAD